MWYTLSAHGCRNCGHDCDPLAERCKHCRQHPFTGSEWVSGPLTGRHFLTLTGLRLMVAIPVFSFLWFVKQTKSGDEWRTYALIIATILCLLALMLHAIQVLQLCFIRIVMEPEGLTIYRKTPHRRQSIQFGWSELDLPAKVTRYKWMRWLGCLMGFTHMLHLLLPEPLSEIRLRSVESNKRFQFPSTPSFNREHDMLLQMSLSTLSFWLDRRLITIDPEHQPSKENRLLYLWIERRYLYAYSEEEHKKRTEEIFKAHEPAGQEQLIIETEGERVLRTMDPKAEAEQEGEYFGVPYGKNYLLWVDW
jgi:hypothetical protein